MVNNGGVLSGRIKRAEEEGDATLDGGSKANAKRRAQKQETTKSNLSSRESTFLLEG